MPAAAQELALAIADEFVKVTPHGNDYGRAWLRRWQAEHRPDSAATPSS